LNDRGRWQKYCSEKKRERLSSGEPAAPGFGVIKIKCPLEAEKRPKKTGGMGESKNALKRASAVGVDCPERMLLKMVAKKKNGKKEKDQYVHRNKKD